VKKYSNGILVDMTTSEITERDTVISIHNTLEISLSNLRDKRNSLLTETDWWGASDNTMTDAQKKYRQDLRDLTTGLDTVEKVNSVTWPTKPGA
jgi:hypothetical protein